jgi:hypothetical protein
LLAAQDVDKMKGTELARVMQELLFFGSVLVEKNNLQK